MSYEHDLIERAAQVMAPEDPSFEGLLRRRDRKRRNQRLAAGAVGLALGIAVMALGAAFLRAAGESETGTWPPPSITTTPIVQPDEVLLSSSPPDNSYLRARGGCLDGSASYGGRLPGQLWADLAVRPCRPTAAGSPITSGHCEECSPVEPETGLWVVGAGAHARLVLPGNAPRSWSPTGAQLAYADVDELILLDPTTWEHTAIATAARHHRGISWGPDGRSIAYTVEPPSSGTGDDGSFGVFVVRSGREPQRVSGAGGPLGSIGLRTVDPSCSSGSRATEA